MKLNKKSYIYIGMLFIIAAVTYSFILFNFPFPSLKSLFFWTILSIIVESFLIPLPNNSIGISVGYAINLAAIIAGGPVLGTTSAFLGVLFRFPNIDGRGYVHVFNSPLYKNVFNVSQSIIVTGFIGIIYLVMGGAIGSFVTIPIMFLLIIGVLFNTVIISGFLAIVNNQNFIYIWFNNIKGTFLNSIAVGTIGIIMAIAFIGYGYGAVILFFGPLMLARYSFKLYIDIGSMYISTIDAFNSALEAKDNYTAGHASRVEEYSIKLGQAYGLSPNRIENLKNAAMLHDIGKIGIRDEVLNKVGKLTSEEYGEMMHHPTIGADIIKKVDLFGDISEIIRYHHERYDGKGYPKGLSGNAVPIESYMLAIADSYDAMTTDRTYREALTKDEALEQIKLNAGSQFHPEIAKLFLEIFS